MSRSGHFYGIESQPRSMDGSMEFVARVHCMIKPFVVRDIIVPILLRQIVDLAVRSGCCDVPMSVR